MWNRHTAPPLRARSADPKSYARVAALATTKRCICSVISPDLPEEKRVSTAGLAPFDPGESSLRKGKRQTHRGRRSRRFLWACFAVPCRKAVAWRQAGGSHNSQLQPALRAARKERLTLCGEIGVAVRKKVSQRGLPRKRGNRHEQSRCADRVGMCEYVFEIDVSCADARARILSFVRRQRRPESARQHRRHGLRVEEERGADFGQRRSATSRFLRRPRPAPGPRQGSHSNRSRRSIQPNRSDRPRRARHPPLSRQWPIQQPAPTSRLATPFCSEKLRKLPV